MSFGRRSSKRVSRSSSFQAASPELLAATLQQSATMVRSQGACDSAKSRLISDDLESSSLDPADDVQENNVFQLVPHEVILNNVVVTACASLGLYVFGYHGNHGIRHVGNWIFELSMLV